MEGGKFNPQVFKAYDIRGIPGKDFGTAFAERLGNRIGGWLGGVVVVGRDGRDSSAKLAQAVIRGAVAAGAHVIDIGEASTPQFAWAVRSQNAAGGLMVTASHLPGSANGFKVLRSHGDAVEVVGGGELHQRYSTSAVAGAGSVRSEDILPGYAAAVAYAAGWRSGEPLRLAVQGPPAVVRVLERLGSVAPDDALAARFDADGDRLALFAGGEPLPADALFAYLAERLTLEPLVMDLRFSRAVRERLDQRGTPYAVSKVGRVALTSAMRATGAAFGGELSGHYYWRSMGGVECPELTLLAIYRLCGGDAGHLLEALAPYRRYARSEEVSIPVRDAKHADQLMTAAEQVWAGTCPASRDDGLTVDCWDFHGFWFNLRPSNTEPVMRLVVEAKEKDLLERKLAEVRDALG